MWVSKKRWEEMEKRVVVLENGHHCRNSTIHNEPRMTDWGRGIAPWVRDPSTPITTVVQAILDHLGLKLRIDPAQGEKVRLERHHEWTVDDPQPPPEGVLQKAAWPLKSNPKRKAKK